MSMEKFLRKLETIGIAWLFIIVVLLFVIVSGGTLTILAASITSKIGVIICATGALAMAVIELLIAIVIKVFEIKALDDDYDDNEPFYMSIRVNRHFALVFHHPLSNKTMLKTSV